jgi:hypothetical protein
MKLASLKSDLDGERFARPQEDASRAGDRTQTE